MKTTMAVLFLTLVLLATTGQMWVRQDKADFYCQMISTATGLTQITGCVGLAATTAAAPTGKNLYIKSIVWSPSIISTTTNFFSLKYGTKASTDCDTGTTVLFNDFTNAAFAGRSALMDPPLLVPTGNMVCFVHPGAGTRNVNITGYIQ